MNKHLETLTIMKYEAVVTLLTNTATSNLSTEDSLYGWWRTVCGGGMMGHQHGGDHHNTPVAGWLARSFFSVHVIFLLFC